MEPGGGSADIDVVAAESSDRGSRRGLAVVALIGLVLVFAVVGAMWWLNRDLYATTDSQWYAVTASADGRTLTFHTLGNGCGEPGSVSFDGDPIHDDAVTATAHYRQPTRIDGHSVAC